jgi:flavodoxin
MKVLKGVIIYDSNFGNTERIARALALGLEDKGAKIDCFKIDQVDVEKLVEYDFVAIGGPTHIISASKSMKEFLGKLKTVDLRGLKGFSFDTRNESRMNSRKWLMLENSSSRVIESALRGMKVDIVKPRRSAIVEGREGPLHEGKEETFKQIGVEIAETLQ